MSTIIKSITTSNYTFEDIITGGDLYVDKTDYFHKLVSVNKGIFFLSCPRRFGKSLSVSIMEEIYQNIIYSIFRLMGADNHNEVHLNNATIV